ncbi:DUF1642 domain-containing protein [Streptococcus suis]|nr:DUF1642 domain-containing protein [Streptococcus suis]
MNKQEAIKRIEQMGEYERFVDEPISKGSVLNIISQIHEPQKVVVPKVVATWIEYCKQSNLDLDHSMRCTRVNNAETGVEEWIYENRDLFTRAWLDGFEIEQEKLYTVEIPDPNGWYKVCCLTRRSNGKLCIDGFDYKDILLETRAHFTESEIKQDFE